MKRVLVTGATGFVGNYVIEELLHLGCQVIASSSDRRKADGAIWAGGVSYIQLNFEDLDPQINYYEFFGRPDVLIHLAWEGLPNYKSLFHFEENLPRHYLFLKNVVVNGCKNVTVAGTCLEYGMRQGKLSEDMLSDPSNPYAIAKDSLRKFLFELQKVSPFVFKWVRLFYLYGKGQNPNSLFSQLDRSLNEGDAVFNMSGGEQIRDYLSIERAATYIVKIALQDRITGVVNCCSGEPILLKKMVEQFIRDRNKDISLNLGYYGYPDYEPMEFWGDNKKLKTILNE